MQHDARGTARDQLGGSASQGEAQPPFQQLRTQIPYALECILS